MSRKINPFPAYPVASLHPGTEFDALTVQTPGIIKADDLLERYLKAVGDGENRGVNVAVSGPFGSGKTHLLGYIECRLRRLSMPRETGILTLGTIEATPAEWYQATVGAQIGLLNLEQLATELYAKAGSIVALQTPLTSSAAAHLEQDPGQVRVLVQNDLLNPTSVEGETISILNQIAPQLAPSVRVATELMIYNPRPALRWLEGQSLSDREIVATGLPRNLTSDREAADAIVAVAAIHRYLDRPFAMLVDELEHLLRVDERRDGKKNVTWFKRLLERLEGNGALVFVAGHSSAWEGNPDFLERFSPGASIELAGVDGRDVLEIAERHEGTSLPLSPPAADLIAEYAKGNVRQVITLLRQLHERTNGFAAPPSEEEIRAAAADIRRRTDPEQALDALIATLGDLGLRVSRRAAIGGLVFDLVAYRDGKPALVVEAKHARFGKQQQEQIQRFIDKLRLANREAPACAGLFLSEGEIERELLNIDPSEARLFWLDLTRPGFVEEAREVLEPVLQVDPPIPVPDPSNLDVTLAEINEEIQERKDEQAVEYEGLRARLEADDEDGELRFRAPSSTETQDMRRTIYEEFNRRPPLLSRFALIPTNQLFVASILLVLGIALMVLAPTLADSFAHTNQEYTLIRTLCFVGGMIGFVTSVFLVARQLLRLDRFFTFREERLRDVYVLDLPLQAIVDTNRILDQALSHSGPGKYGMEDAFELLHRAGLARDFALKDPEYDD